MDPYQLEEEMERSFDSRLLKRLMKFALPYWHYIVLSIALLLIITLGDLVRPFLIKVAIDNYININGREYLAVDIDSQYEDGVIFDNKRWIPVKETADGQEGEVYTFIQHQKVPLLVLGQLPKDKEDLVVNEDNGQYSLILDDKEYEAKVIPKDFVKEFRSKDIEKLMQLMYLFFGIACFMFFLNYVQSILLQFTGQKILYDMRQRIFAHISNLSFSFFDKNPVGKLVTRVTNDTETLNEMYTNVLVNLFKDIFMLIGIAIVMLSINFKLALIVFTTIPIITVSTVIFRIKARRAHRRVRTLLSRINSFLSEHISGMKIIQIFHQQDRKSKEFDDVNHDYYKATLKEMKIFAIFRPLIEFLFSFALTLLLWFGGGQLLRGTLEFGVVFAFVNYIEMFFRPINDLSEKYNIMQAAMASAEKIFSVLDEDSIIKEAEHPISLDKVEGKIEFKNVWFAYNDEDWVLKDISFTINPGETVAFVGATGAGKTSIINLITRFYDIQKGQILLDDVPIDKLYKDDLRRHIGVVLQDVFLFTGDIEYNIKLNNSNIPREKIEDIARYVNADKFIQKLPNTYSEKVAERGATLSTGQRQLLAFARALAFNPAVLVLDEATANIDTETEELIQDALAKLIKGRTTIAIAHRLSTIQHADKIIVLHKGRIQEMGTHQELLNNKGLYYQLYELQYKKSS